MIRIMLGVLAAVVLALGFTMWRLDAAKESLEVERAGRVASNESLRAAIAELATAKEGTAAFEEEVRVLRVGEAQRRKEVVKGVADIRAAKKVEGDSDASFNCLDTVVPIAIDSRLRKQAAPRGD